MSKKNTNKKEAVSTPAPTSASKKLSVQLITLITVGVLILGVIITAIAMWISGSVDYDKDFDYVKSDISQYVYISPDKYKDVELKLDIA
ncbi:MAG: hypothetical protein IIX30_05560, partial [Clostridia bacterium]|nr:hypothetical protein [Clostridia bacterium]